MGGSKIRAKIIEALKKGKVQHEMLDGQINTLAHTRTDKSSHSQTSSI